MQCGEIRELAEAYVSAEVPGEAARAVAEHLEGCPACQAEVEGLRRLRASLRSAWLASPDLSPRPGFATAVAARVRSEAARRRGAAPWRRTWLVLAATLVLLVGGGFGVRGLGVRGFTAIVQAAVNDHRFCLVAFELTERPIPLEQAAEVYDDPADRSLETVEPSPAVLSGGPVRIVERHSCVYADRRFAHIVLRYKRALISLVITPDERAFRNLPGASPPRSGSIVDLGPVDGFNVTAFRGPRHAAFVISTLGDDDLREVAQAMWAPVSRALAGS